jgi:hypothetical protein
MLAGCAKEPPPRSVAEFIDNPILLEAAMVRCSQDREGTKYDAECVNARQAVARVQAKEEAAAKAVLEARSENKRKALRRTQAAAAEARRRTADAERLRKEAEYLAQFGVSPPEGGEMADTLTEGEPLAEGNLPVAVVPDVPERPGTVGAVGEAEPATDGGNAPVSEQPEPAVSDLESVRDELRRRNEEGNEGDED